MIVLSQLRPLRPLAARWLVPCAVALSATLPATLSAQPAAHSESARTEARERFDRGLRLFNQQDNQGALAEFVRAYELVPHPLVLYNIGLVYAATARPVQAVEAFDRLLGAPAGLSAEKLSRVGGERDRQAALIAEIEIVSPVADAIVEVDGVEVGRTPLASPLRVASGSHVVGLIASGYAPSRKSLMVAGKTRTRVEFALVAQAAQLAHLTVRTRLPGAEVIVDGERVGTTPLAASLALTPGTHAVELRRPGYISVTQTLTLGPASTGTIDLEPQLDPASLRSEGGDVALVISEPGAVVFVDGKSHGPYRSPLRLPAGEHVIRIERADFFSVERKILVRRGQHESVPIELEPTPEKRARYRTVAVRQRTWGWVGVVAGGTLLAGGGGFLIWNQAQKNDAESDFDARAAQNQSGGGGDCDPELGQQTDACIRGLELALERLDGRRGRDVFGWVGVGVGAAALGTGLFLLLSNDDPDRYEPREESDVFGALRLAPAFAIRERGGVLAVSGRF